MKLYLHPNPQNAVERKQNKENLRLAEDILAIRKSNYIQGKFEIKNLNKSKRAFLEYFREKTEEKSNSVKNHGVWQSALVHLNRCISPNLIFEEIEDSFL